MDYDNLKLNRFVKTQSEVRLCVQQNTVFYGQKSNSQTKSFITQQKKCPNKFGAFLILRILKSYSILVRILTSVADITPTFSISAFKLGLDAKPLATSTLGASVITVTKFALSTETYTPIVLMPALSLSGFPASNPFFHSA